MQSLIDAGEIAHALNAMYDKGIDHAIQTVMETMKRPHDATDNFAFYQEIIKQLSKLKSNDSR